MIEETDETGEASEVFTRLETSIKRFDASESVFGKMRGRFDEAAARDVDRTLSEAAMSALTAMPSDQWPRFIAAFNAAFRWGKPPCRIIVERK